MSYWFVLFWATGRRCWLGVVVTLELGVSVGSNLSHLAHQVKSAIVPSDRFFNNVVICTSRLHWWVWDYWWPQSRKNRRQSHRQAEQGKLCFSWPSLTLTFMSLLVRQFQANAHNVWISCVGINHELSWMKLEIYIFPIMSFKCWETKCVFQSAFMKFMAFFSFKERFCLKRW